MDTPHETTRRGEFVTDWEQWHDDHERRRSTRHGFLSITGLHWLSGQPQRFDDAPGEWSSDGDDVRVALEDDEKLVVDDVSIKGEYRFSNVDEIGRRAHSGDILIEVARRDDQYMIRPRDPGHVVRTNYAGTPAYVPNTDWVVEGRFVPYDEPRPVGVGATVEGLTHVYTTPGEIAFELDGLSLRLIAFNGDSPDDLFIVFRDATAGDTTYAACRFLDVDPPGAKGRVTLDFNRARNPPCAYTDFTTCPLPPPGNDLPIRVEAGERMPVPSVS